MADRQRPHRHGGPLRKGRQRHLFAGQRRLDVDVVQRIDRALQLGQHLEDDVVAVELGEVLRHLALAERVIQRIVDQLRLDAIARGGVAVDLQFERGAAALLVGGDVAQLRQRLHLAQNLRRPFVQFGEVGVLQRELELGAGRAAAKAHVLRGLHEQAGAQHLFQLRAQPGNDLLRIGVALAQGLQRDEHVAVVAGAAAAADRHCHRRDARILHDDLAELFLLAFHVREGNVLAGFRGRADQADVLLREEALRDDDEHVDRQRQGGEEDQQRRALPAQGNVEHGLIAAQHGIEAALAELVETAVPFLIVGAQEARGHHRGQCQRHEHRDEDRHRQHDGELAEQAADDAAHQQQRDQHGDQRDADRDDGEADLARALEGGRHRLLAFLDIAADVLQHHDGVVDDEADRDRQRHQRQIVQRVAEHPHQRAGAEQRQWHRHGGDHGRPEAAQEGEDHHHDQEDGQEQGELDVLHRGADRGGAVGDHLDLDRRRNGGDQAGQCRLDLVDCVDDIGAGLLEDDEEHAALAIGPGGLLGVLRSGDGLADVTDTQRPAIAVGDDDVVPGLRGEQLVVGIDGVGAGGAVDIALRAVDGRDIDRGADVFQRQALGDQLGGIDLDPDRWLLLTADDDLRDAGNLADLLGKLGVDGVADRGQRQRLRGCRQQHDRRVRRVDLAIGRRRGEALRQLAAGGVDGSLDVVGGAVDRAVEVELDGDRCRAEIARRGHLRDAGDLRELALQRLRDRGRHCLRAAARERRGDLDGREVDLRQWRDR